MLNVIVLACGTGVGLSPETLRLLDVMNRSPEARVLVVGIHRPRPDFANLRIDMSRLIQTLRYERKATKRSFEAPMPRFQQVGNRTNLRGKIMGQQGRASVTRPSGGRHSR